MLQSNLSPAFFAALIMSGLLGASAEPRPAATSQVSGVTIEIYTPAPEQFELALDEIELAWVQVDPNRKDFAAVPTATSGTRVLTTEKGRTILAVEGATSPPDLAGVSRSLEGANPGSEVMFVLYEAGQPRSPSTRRVLTTEVALVLEDADDPAGILATYAARNPKPVAEVPGSYVLRTGDPLAAVSLADALRATPGVKTAYNLVRRMQALR